MESWEIKRYVGIDVLRVAFAITVAIYHTGKLFDFAPSGLLQFIYYYGGYFGNYFFFMSSGLLIFSALLSGMTIIFHKIKKRQQT